MEQLDEYSSAQTLLKLLVIWPNNLNIRQLLTSPTDTHEKGRRYFHEMSDVEKMICVPVHS